MTPNHVRRASSYRLGMAATAVGLYLGRGGVSACPLHRFQAQTWTDTSSVSAQRSARLGQRQIIRAGTGRKISDAQRYTVHVGSNFRRCEGGVALHTHSHPCCLCTLSPPPPRSFVYILSPAITKAIEQGAGPSLKEQVGGTIQFRVMSDGQEQPYHLDLRKDGSTEVHGTTCSHRAQSRLLAQLRRHRSFSNALSTHFSTHP